MIVMLTVMSDLDLSHDLLGYGWLGQFRLGLVGLVHGIQQVQILCACLATGGMSVTVGRFGYMCDSCELEALDYRG
jgi:hypothetical protein